MHAGSSFTEETLRKDFERKHLRATATAIASMRKQVWDDSDDPQCGGTASTCSRIEGGKNKACCDVSVDLDSATGSEDAFAKAGARLAHCTVHGRVITHRQSNQSRHGLPSTPPQ